jgi:hypothetical protein
LRDGTAVPSESEEAIVVEVMGGGGGGNIEAMHQFLGCYIQGNIDN